MINKINNTSRSVWKKGVVSMLTFEGCRYVAQWETFGDILTGMTLEHQICRHLKTRVKVKVNN